MARSLDHRRLRISLLFRMLGQPARLSFLNIALTICSYLKSSHMTSITVASLVIDLYLLRATDAFFLIPVMIEPGLLPFHTPCEYLLLPFPHPSLLSFLVSTNIAADIIPAVTTAAPANAVHFPPKLAKSTALVPRTTIESQNSALLSCKAPTSQTVSMQIR